jgi:hypothetical protein
MMANPALIGTTIFEVKRLQVLPNNDYRALGCIPALAFRWLRFSGTSVAASATLGI